MYSETENIRKYYIIILYLNIPMKENEILINLFLNIVNDKK